MISPTLFPVLRSGYTLHITAGESTLFNAVRATGGSRVTFGFSSYHQWKVPAYVARYLVACDGKTTHGQIAADISGDTLPQLGEILAQQAVTRLLGTGVLGFSPTPLPIAPDWRTTGGFDSYAPLHMSFEITETCNFKCEHCYVSASPEKHGRKNGQQTIVVLDRLASSGVVVIELTGGECTTHPEFKDILHHASEKFHLVAIISNGYLLGKRPDLADFVGSHENVVVQISIDGLKEFHDRFRAMPGAFDAACAAVRRLKSWGTFVRIGASISTENLDQVEGVYRLAKDLGVDALAIAAVTSFGRGAHISGCAKTEHAVSQKIGEILKPYAEDPLFDPLKRELAELQRTGGINCGAGWRSFALNSDGTVRSCLFLVDSKKFGNLDHHDYNEVFRQPEMTMFHNAPSPGGPECRGVQPDGSTGCRYLPVCFGCFAKAFRISETEYPGCPWRAAHFPGMSLNNGGVDAFVPIDELFTVRSHRSYNSDAKPLPK